MAAQPITCYFRLIRYGHAVRGCCGKIQTWSTRLSIPDSSNETPVSFLEICHRVAENPFRMYLGQNTTSFNSITIPAENVRHFWWLMPNSRSWLMWANICFFWIVFLQHVCLPQIDPSPIVFCVWPFHAYNWAGPLCAWTTPTLLSPSKWTNMLFPKSEIHLQLLASTSHTDEKVFRAQQEQTVLFFHCVTLESTLQNETTHTLVLGSSIVTTLFSKAASLLKISE